MDHFPSRIAESLSHLSEEIESGVKSWVEKPCLIDHDRKEWNSERLRRSF